MLSARFSRPAMQQLLLDVRPPNSPKLARFITGRNAELRAQLDAMLAGEADEKMVYLWGERGCGKSYLLAAWADACLEAGLSVGEGEFDDVVVLDAAQTWSDARQQEVFALYNRVRSRGGLWLVAGDAPPALLPLFADLRSRLGWGLVFQLLPLADAEKRSALVRHAAGLGFELDASLADYLLTHTSREMQHLLATLDHLDCLSLQTQRPVNLSLLKTLLAQA